jgi:hypothetical protein
MTPQSSQLKSPMNLKSRQNSRQNSSQKQRGSIVSPIAMKKINKDKDIEKFEEKIELIMQLLSKNSVIDKVSPIFYKIPDSAILKSKKWSSDDELAEVSFNFDLKIDKPNYNFRLYYCNEVSLKTYGYDWPEYGIAGVY